MRNLASRNAGRKILKDLEHELRALDQARFATDRIHFDSIEGQGCLDCVIQERLNELKVEVFDLGALRREEAMNVPAISTFVPPNSWHQSQPCHKRFKARVSKNRGQTCWVDWLKLQ